jgi:hypothetical protein
MRAALMHGAGDVSVEEVPDSAVELPTDALVRITAYCIWAATRGRSPTSTAGRWPCRWPAGRLRRSGT